MAVNLASNYDCSILSRFPDKIFFAFFQKKFQEFKVNCLKFLILHLGLVRSLKVVANLTSTYGCSSLCSFRDATFL